MGPFSNFFILSVSAIVAAFCGAFVNQWLSERNRRKISLEKEIQNTNAAINLAWTLCNHFINLKEQNVYPLKKIFDQQIIKMNEFYSKRDNNSKFKFQAQFLVVPCLLPQTNQLQILVFEKISPNARPISLVATLAQTIDSLNSVIKIRDQIIKTTKDNRSISDDALECIYFGRPDMRGSVDSSYPNSINAIFDLTNDCIFYSNLLCNDLIAHGNKLKKRYENKSPKKDTPTVIQLSFEKAEQKGLMPNPESYADWFSAFKRHSDQANSGR